MANPKHSNPAQPRRDGSWAHAPYNFIPLPEKVVTVAREDIPDHDSYKFAFETFTGYLDCTLVTETPTFTRRGMNLDFFQKWADKTREMMQDAGAREEHAQFFSLDDVERPVIPGSSLRGMVRSLVEIAGYGKMQWVTERQLVFRAVADLTSLGEYYRHRLLRDDGKKRFGKKDRVQHYTPIMQAGYLEKQRNRWFIRPATIINGASFARIRTKLIPRDLSRWNNCKNAYRIWVKPGQYDYQPVRGGFICLKYIPVLEAVSSAKDGFQEAVLVYSGHMDSKQREAVVFPPNPDNSSLIEIDPDLIEAYQEQVSQEQQKLLGKDGALNPSQPVFYLLENNRLIFFGHVMMFRLPYNRSPLDFVPESLRQENFIDLAEAIFGYIPAKHRQEGQAGRVYFGDAHFENANDGVWLQIEPITPKILTTPKPTTFQHYLTQQQPDEVESGGKNKDGTPKMELKLDHYASPPPHETVTRGHKLYWHRGPVDLKETEENTPVNWTDDTQHTRIRPVNRGVTFRFKVYFENLRDYELGALLWVLDLPPDCRHKIGLGKPLGLGSVHITPRLILSNRQTRYSQLFSGGQWVTGEQEKSNLSEFKQAFESFVLARIDERERKSSFGQVERIKMLLAMLQWPGPDKELTKYMTVQPVNEYRHRPVLPDPLHVESPSLLPDMPRPAGPARPQPQKTGSSSGAETTSRPGQRRVLEKPDASPARPGLELPEVGDSFTEQIVQIRTNGDVVIRYKDLPTDQVFTFIPAGEVGGKQYRVGNQARCQVTEKYKQGNKWVLKCKPGPKREK